MKPFEAELQIPNLSDVQRKYFEIICSRCKEITINQLSDLPVDLSPYIDFDEVKQKECYANAARIHLGPIVGKGFKIEYCEGYIEIANIHIEHAFNKLIYDGQEFYFDLTSEKLKLLYGYEFTHRKYHILKSYPQIELMHKLLSNECYGPFTETDIRNELNN